MITLLRLLPIIALSLFAYFLAGPAGAYSLNDPLLNSQNQDLSSGNLVATTLDQTSQVSFNWLWLVPLILIPGGLYLLFIGTQPAEHYEFTASPRYDIAFHDIREGEEEKKHPSKKPAHHFKKKIDKIF